MHRFPTDHTESRLRQLNPSSTMYEVNDLGQITYHSGLSFLSEKSTIHSQGTVVKN